MLNSVILNYLKSGIGGSPDVLEHLLGDLRTSDPRWDFRPDSERFTLREMVAHMADWEPIHLERLRRILNEENPLLPDIDEGKLAADNDYSHSNPQVSLASFRSRRQKTLEEIESVNETQWQRVGMRDKVGPVTTESFAVLILAHDAYHLRQAVEWLNLAAASTATD